jgi:predicted histidine transporter YuiF (NhaC family)
MELIMSKIKDFLKSPHIQIALVTGICIIALAYFSKRILPRPIGYLPAAIPPFLMAIYEGFVGRHKNKKITSTWYWIVAIILSTAVIIMLHWQ